MDRTLGWTLFVLDWIEERLTIVGELIVAGMGFHWARRMAKEWMTGG